VPSTTQPPFHALIINNLHARRKFDIDFWIRVFDTVCMNSRKTALKPVWQKTPYANLIRYNPSGTYFARLRVRGKLIRRSLKTTKITVAKLRLADFEKEERQKAESHEAMTGGTMSFGDAVKIYRERLTGDGSLKPRSKSYREERLAALQKSWTNLERTDVRKISKHNCLTWAANYAQKAAPSNFNNTVGTLRLILDIAVEAGARYDNPARFIKRVRIRQKQLHLPSHDDFLKLVEMIENVNKRFSKDCADLVRFLAFGGFRKSEAARVTWADCDFDKKQILVRGDPETGTKNWSIRHVPMIPDMYTFLKQTRTDRSDESSNASVMKIRECQNAINSACQKLNIPRFTHHDLRHLFATRCIESGVDIPTVSRWLGHKDGGALAMKVYGHLRDQHSVSMAQKVTFTNTQPSNVIPMAPKAEAG
jgi:integrase